MSEKEIPQAAPMGTTATEITEKAQATPMESAVGVNLRRQMRLWVGAVLHGTVSPEAFGKWFARLTDAEVTLVAGESVLRA